MKMKIQLSPQSPQKLFIASFITALLILLAFNSTSQTIPFSSLPKVAPGSLYIAGTNSVMTSTVAIPLSKITGTNVLQPQLNGTGLVRQTGTVTAYDNSTYLTAAGDVTTTATQTLTNKTITSPTLTGVATASNTNYNGVVNQNKSTSAASSSTVDLSALNGNYAHITGTTTINNFGIVQAGAERTLVFDGILTITSNTASIILPNNLSVLTNTNDVAVFRSEGSGVWRLVSYQMADNSSISYSPTWTGFSTPPSGGTYTYILIGKLCYVNIAPTSSGVTNSTACTVTLPFNAKYASNGSGGFAVDATTKTLFWATVAGSNSLTLVPSAPGSSWLNSGGAKRANTTVVYEIQ